MDGYRASGTIAAVTAAPGDTALGIIASTLTRARIDWFTVKMGTTGTVADNVLQWLIRRFTALGTSTPVTPIPDDLAAPAAQLAAGQGYTVEPTYSVTLFDEAIHQRSIYQWNSQPGREFVVPAIANNGIGITPISASYVGPGVASAHWME